MRRPHKRKPVVPGWAWVVAWLAAIGLLVMIARPALSQNQGTLRYLQLALGSEGAATEADWQALAAHYAGVQDQIPAHSSLLRTQALVDLQLGDLAAAGQRLTVYQALEPDDPTGYYLLGLVAWENGDRQRALDLWLPLQPWKQMIRLAEEAAEAGEIEAALFVSEPVARRMTEYGTGYRLVSLYQTLLRLDSPEREQVCAQGAFAFRRAVEIQPDYGYLRINQGTFLRECGQGQAALEALAAIDESYNSTLQAWASSERGLTYLALGQPEAALDAFRRAVNLEPGNAGYLSLLEQMEEKVKP